MYNSSSIALHVRVAYVHSNVFTSIDMLLRSANNPDTRRALARRVCLLSVALSVVTAVSVRAQDVTVRAATGTERQVSASEFAALPHITLETTDHGTPVSFEGVALSALLKFAGAGPVDSLRGPLLRRAVLAIGVDGYGAIVALADLDDAIGARRVMVADRMNGAPLPADHGPLRLIVPGDKRGARWVRQVVRLEIVTIQ